MTTPGAPVAFRLKRPYASEGEFVEGDGVGIFKSGMILVGAGSRPEGVIVRFEITLRDGTALFRGEGKVVAHHPQPEGDIPAGLEIKFTRLDANGKSIVDRALKLKAALATPQPAAIPELGVPDAPGGVERLPSLVERVPSVVEAIPSPSDPHIVPSEILAERVPQPEPTAIAPPVELVEAGIVAADPSTDPPMLERLRVRKISFVERPNARDELLGKLRARGR